MNNDEFAMEDLDDEKTIAYIKERLPQDLKEKFSDDEFYYFLDTIYDYYDKSGILDSGDEYVDIDINDGHVIAVTERLTDTLLSLDGLFILLITTVPKI